MTKRVSASPSVERRVRQRVWDETQGGLYPITLGSHVSKFTALFEAKCTDVEQAIKDPVKIWEKNKACEKKCSDQRGYYFLKGSEGKIVIMGWQQPGKKDIHTSFKNMCLLISQETDPPEGSIVWLADLSKLPSRDAKTMIRKKMQIDQDHRKLLCRALTSTQGFYQMDWLLSGQTLLQYWLNKMNWGSILNWLPASFVHWQRSFTPIIMENLARARLATFLPDTMVNSTSPYLLPIGITCYYVFLQVGCFAFFSIKDLKQCLQTPKKDAYQKTYIFIWCMLAFLMFLILYWGYGSISALYTTLKPIQVITLFDNLLGGLKDYLHLPTNALAHFIILLQSLVGINDLWSFLSSFFQKQGLAENEANAAIQDFRTVYEHAPPPDNSGRNISWLLGAQGLIWLSNFFMNCIHYVRGSGFFGDDWESHLEKVAQKIASYQTRTHSHGALNVTQGNSFTRTIETQVPTLDFIRLLIGAVSELLMILTRKLKGLCVSETSIGPGMPLKRFERPLKAALVDAEQVKYAKHDGKDVFHPRR